MTEDEYAKYASTPEGAAERKIIEAAFPPKARCDATHETLKEYVDRVGEPVGPAVMAEYDRSMREDVIPKIEASMRGQARAAHYLRLGIETPAPAPVDSVVDAMRQIREARDTLNRALEDLIDHQVALAKDDEPSEAMVEAGRAAVTGFPSRGLVIAIYKAMRAAQVGGGA